MSHRYSLSALVHSAPVAAKARIKTDALRFHPCFRHGVRSITTLIECVKQQKQGMIGRYGKSDNLRGFVALLTTLVPLALLWWLAVSFGRTHALGGGCRPATAHSVHAACFRADARVRPSQPVPQRRAESLGRIRAWRSFGHAAVCVGAAPQLPPRQQWQLGSVPWAICNTFSR